MMYGRILMCPTDNPNEIIYRNNMDLFSVIDKVWKNEPVSNPELTVLLRWLLSEEGRNGYLDKVQREWEGFHTDSTRDYSAFLDKINRTIDSKEKARKKPLSRRLGRIAAVIVPLLLVAGIGIYYMTGGFEAQEYTIAQYSGSPTLIMPDGSTINLDGTAEAGRIAEAGNVAFVREDGKLIQKRETDDAEAAVGVEWGSIVAPKGSLADMVFEDGTQVWLNADSRLRFPLGFSGGERRVHLEGEAYFAVARNESMPFVVETRRQSITVLGTEFNVSAYPGAGNELTTLVDGSVMVSAGGGSVNLTPGQQALLSPGFEGVLIKNVDTGDYTAWRDGIFVFEDTTLRDVFVKLSRWYDIEYSFKNKALGELTLSGTLPHSENVNDLLRAIALVVEVDITVRGKKVTVDR